MISVVLLLIWRTLANAAAGNVFSGRAVRYVRGIGWLLIVGNVADAVLGQVAKGGYTIEAFGYGPHLQPFVAAEIELGQLALGGLVVLLAEVFRHGADVEAERRLTV